METVTSPPGAEPDANPGSRNGPYDLRPRKNAAKEVTHGAGGEAPVGANEKTGAQTRTTFQSVDVKPAEFAEEFSDAVEGGPEYENDEQDRYEIRSEASITDSLGARSIRRVGDTEKGRPKEQDRRTPRQLPIPPLRAALGGGRVGQQRHRHTPPPVFDEMTWEELDAYRRVHSEFQRRAQRARTTVSPRPDEPLDRGDPRGAGREARPCSGDRREPRTSHSFGNNSTASSRRPGVRSATGELSDSGAQCGARTHDPEIKSLMLYRLS